MLITPNILPDRFCKKSLFVQNGDEKLPFKKSVQTKNGVVKEKLLSPVPKPYYLCQKQPTFGISKLEKGQLLDLDGKIFNRNVTCYCRSDLDWSNFGGYLKKKFKDISKVNIQDFACSTGDEAYSLALLLTKVYGDSDFKINASDINGSLIERNMKNQESGIEVDGFISYKILRELSIDSKDTGKYFYPADLAYTQIRSKISNKVNFRKANILSEIDRLDGKSPSLILCRNMWPYIDSLQYDSFARKLYEKTAPGSVVVVGSYDYMGEERFKASDKFPQMLIRSGFKPVMFPTGLNMPKDALIFEK